MSSSIHEITEIILAEDYPKLNQMEIGKTNSWLKNKFGTRFQCQDSDEASRLIKNMSAWTRYHQLELKNYINSEIWQNRKIDALAFQKEILATNFKRVSLRRKRHTVMKMLKDMLKLFCLSQQRAKESPFEKNKIRNFIASSKLEGIYLEDI